jgi:hypothetical protein
VPFCRIERAISSKRVVFRTAEVMVLEDPGQPAATSEAGARLDRTYADVRFGGDFEPVTASTPKQREVLLEQVKAHVTAELASRQRKRA